MYLDLLVQEVVVALALHGFPVVRVVEGAQVQEASVLEEVVVEAYLCCQTTEEEVGLEHFPFHFSMVEEVVVGQHEQYHDQCDLNSMKEAEVEAEETAAAE